jgi:hypothetical protein
MNIYTYIYYQNIRIYTHKFILFQLKRSQINLHYKLYMYTQLYLTLNNNLIKK